MVNFYLNNDFSYFELIPHAIIVAIFSLHTVLLLTWFVVLFKESRQLRRKAKYSIEYMHDQDTHLDALNSKVEYYKSLFLLAIVSIELVSSILTIAADFDWCIAIIKLMGNPNPQDNQINPANNNIEFNLFNISVKMVVKFVNISFNCNGIHTIPEKWELLDQFPSRTIGLSFDVPFLLVFSPFYILMSYYAMIIRNSLNFNSTIKSVNLALKQKLLILGSFIMFLILFILMVRTELVILFEIFKSCVAFIQMSFTLHYSRKLIRVFNWKILDTKIAFGTDNYQFKTYSKTVRSLKIFLTLYYIGISSFCTYIILKLISFIIIFVHPIELNRVFGFCLPLQQFALHMYVCLLIMFFYINSIILIISMVISTFCLLLLNLSSIPYLLSKMNIRCHFKLKFSKMTGNEYLTQAQEPLL